MALLNAQGQVVSNAGGDLQECDVCRILEGDTTKKMCKFCGMCSAWICDKCRPNMIRRGRAMTAAKLKGLLPFQYRGRE